jgi:winged helix DNA-binding protein
MASPRGGEEVLSTRALNRAVLARQGLIERLSGSIPELLRQMGFLQAQYAPSMYIGIWSRLQGFRRDQLTHALEKREVVQATLLRSTIHLVAAEDYWPAALAIRETRRLWFERVSKGVPGAAALEAAAEKLSAVFAEHGVLSQRQLDERLAPELRAGIGSWMHLVRAPPAGTWEHRRANLYARAEDWIGPAPADLLAQPSRGVELLVRRYLTGFGPAAPASIASWAGLPVTVVRTALAAMQLTRYRGEDGKELVDLPGQTRPDPGREPPARYLPTWDATLLTHCRRAAILPEGYRERIFSIHTPHSLGTLLVDGQVAGTWRYADGSVAREEFEPLPKAVRAELAAEGEQLARLHR